MATKNKKIEDRRSIEPPPDPEPVDGDENDSPEVVESRPTPSYRERLAKLEAEEEVAAKAEYEKRLAFKKVQVPFEAQRGAPYSPPSFHGLSDRLRDPRTALEPSTQEELRRAIESKQDWYRSTTDGR